MAQRRAVARWCGAGIAELVGAATPKVELHRLLPGRSVGLVPD
jgi:hypothetical protein